MFDNFFRNKGYMGSTLLLRFAAATLLVLSNSVANAEPIKSCSLQADCISINATEVSDTGTLPCVVRVCLVLKLGGECSKSDGKISHTCVKNENPGEGFGFAEASALTGVRNGFAQCQIVTADTEVQFLLKDGGGCQDGGDWPLNGETIDGFDASCEPRPDDVESCTGNKLGMECIWTVKAPNLCSPPSPSVSPAPSDIPSSVPSKSPSASPAPASTPEETEDPCPLAQEFPIEGTVPGSALNTSCGPSCYEVQDISNMTSGSIAYRTISADIFDYRAKVCGVGCVDGSCAKMGLGVYDSLNADALFISVSMVPFGGFHYSYNTGSFAESVFLPVSDSGYSAAENCMWITINRTLEEFQFKWDYVLGDLEPGKDLCEECCNDVNCENNTHPNKGFCEGASFVQLNPIFMEGDVLLTFEVGALSKGKFRDIEFIVIIP